TRAHLAMLRRTHAEPAQRLLTRPYPQTDVWGSPGPHVGTTTPADPDPHSNTPHADVLRAAADPRPRFLPRNRWGILDQPPGSASGLPPSAPAGPMTSRI